MNGEPTRSSFARNPSHNISSCRKYDQN
jgi:hypothetical protein